MASLSKQNRSLTRLFAVGAVLALTITGCASGEGGENSSGGGTIVFQMGSDPSVVNPVVSTGFADQQLGCTVFEGLTTSDPEGVPLPRLAKDWEVSDDGLEYTFHLVDANWHDGEPFTSEDVKFTYEQYSTNFGPLWGDLAAVFDRVDTPDPHTAIVKLTEPFAPMLLMTRCTHNGAILPKHIYEGVDPLGSEAREITPIGTGPFTWGEAIPGQSYTLEANQDYWQEGKPKADRLVGQIITETASAVSAIRAGEIDYISTLPANAANQLSEVDGIDVLEGAVSMATNQVLFFNTQREPFNKPEVRKALYQALDRQYIADQVYFGRAIPGVSAMTNRIWAYTGEVDYNKLFPYDVQAAAAVLDAAGYPEVNGTRFTLDLLVRNDPPERIEMANVIAAMWDQIGVDVTVRVLERAAENVEAFQDFSFDANIQGLTNYGDPAAGSARMYVCEAVGRNFGNASQFCDPDIDALWTAASRLVDLDERAELYGQIDKALAEQLPTLVIVQQTTEYAQVSNLKGLIFQPDAPDWSGAYLE